MKQWSLFVTIRDGWQNAGRVGISLGPAMSIIPYKGSNGQYWTPVLWIDEEDPNWHKSVGLEPYVAKRLDAKKLLERIQQQPNIVPIEVMPNGSFRDLTPKEVRQWRKRSKTRIVE